MQCRPWRLQYVFGSRKIAPHLTKLKLSFGLPSPQRQITFALHTIVFNPHDLELKLFRFVVIRISIVVSSHATASDDA